MQRKLSRNNIERYREAKEEIYIEFAERMEKIENTEMMKTISAMIKRRARDVKQNKATSHLFPLTKNQKIM